MHSEKRSKKSRNFDGIVFDDQVWHEPTTTTTMMICDQSKAKRSLRHGCIGVGVDYPTVGRSCAAWRLMLEDTACGFREAIVYKQGQKNRRKKTGPKATTNRFPAYAEMPFHHSEHLLV